MTTRASPSVGGVEEKRELILVAAFRVLGEMGYAGTRLRDVGDRAGVSVGLIQHYFDSHENLLAPAMLHAAVPSFDDQARLWLESSNMVMQYPHLSPLLQSVYAT